jgi:hypothetical protein
MLKWLFASAILAAMSETTLWVMCRRYGKMIDNDEWNTLGSITFLFHIPGQIIRELVCPNYPWSDTIGIPIIITTGVIQFFVAYCCLFMVGIGLWKAMTPNKALDPTAPALLGSRFGVRFTDTCRGRGSALIR